MPVVRLTRNLSRFFPDLSDGAVEGATVTEVLDSLEADHPGLRGYLCAEDGSLRKHVNIFVDGEMVADRIGLSDAVGPDGVVHIIQALSGG